MNELRRLYGKKTIFLLVIAVILNMGIFMLSANPEKDITLRPDELDSYIDDYYIFLDNINENSELMSGISIYKDGYAADSIGKTRDAYKNLEGITLHKADNTGIVHFIQYSLSDMVFMAFMIIISVGMIRERKKGLVNFVRSTYNGRAALYFKRVLILAFSAVAAVLLLYGGNYLGMLISTGDCDMSRSIQSLPEFMHCPYKITIGGYIVRMLVIKAAVGFTASLAFFIILSVSGTAVTYIVTGILTVAEFLLYTMIEPISELNFFKYINIFAGLKVTDFYSRFNFIKISEKAVPPFNCMVFIVTLLIIIFILSGIFIHGKMYVTGTGNLQFLRDKILWVLEKISFRKTLTGWELYKLLIKQGGLLFMTGAFMLAFSSSLKYNYYFKTEVGEIEWYRKYEGELTAETLKSANDDYTTMGKQIVYWNNKVNEITARDHVNEKVLMDTERTLNQIKSKREGLAPILENMRDGWEYTSRTGNKVEVIKPYIYELLLVRDTNTSRLASLYALIGIICSVSGIYAYDTQNNMKNTIRSSFRGRKTITASKIIAVFIICVILCTAINLIQIIQINNVSSFKNMDASVQSLSFMRDFPLNVSISEYFILLFVVRAAAAFVAGIISTVVSRYCPDTSTAMGVSIFILVVPSIFAQLVPDMHLIDSLYLMSGEYFR